MIDISRRIELVAQSRSTALLTGETGTGKELVARTIHDRSLQRHLPLIKVNCAAIPDTLIESELFGHARGAFTRAQSAKKGRFALADGGTIERAVVLTTSPRLTPDTVWVMGTAAAPTTEASHRLTGLTPEVSDYVARNPVVWMFCTLRAKNSAEPALGTSPHTASRLQSETSLRLAGRPAPTR